MSIPLYPNSSTHLTRIQHLPREVHCIRTSRPSSIHTGILPTQMKSQSMKNTGIVTNVTMVRIRPGGMRVSVSIVTIENADTVELRGLRSREETVGCDASNSYQYFLALEFLNVSCQGRYWSGYGLRRINPATVY